MSKSAQATFEIKAWDEHPYDEPKDGPKLTRARVTKSYTGDIQGQATLEYLMVHRPDGTASFVGLERITGSLGDRAGSFVLQHNGVFENGLAKAEYFVAPRSGTGDLLGLRGKGRFASGHERHYPMTLEYEFE